MLKDFLLGLKAKGWKQTEISKKTGISQGFISEMQKGKECKIDIIIKIADAFNVTTDEVLGRTPSRTITPEEDMILKVTDGDKDIARAALRSAQGEKLFKEIKNKKAA